MTNFSALDSTAKQVIISLRSYSHEVCVSATQADYWQQVDSNIKNKKWLNKRTSVSITSSGKYVPEEFKSIFNEEDEPRLQLIIQS